MFAHNYDAIIHMFYHISNNLLTMKQVSVITKRVGFLQTFSFGDIFTTSITKHYMYLKFQYEISTCWGFLLCCCFVSFIFEASLFAMHIIII